MEELRPNGQRAKIAITLIWIVLAMDIISIISDCFQFYLLQTVSNGGEITTENATANDLRVRIIAIVYLVIFIISAITFIQWFRRAYFNLHIKAEYLNHSEGWAAGCWFTPIVNLYRPYYIMKELYEKTIELLTKNGLNFNNISTRLLGWWWALWIINNIISQVEFRYLKNSTTVDDYINSTILSIIGQAIGIPLALLAIKVIKDYSKLEPLLDELNIETESETATYNSLYLNEGN